MSSINKKRKEMPKLVPYNSVLKTKNDYEKAIRELESLNLPKHPDPYKNWDSLAALSLILRHTNKNANILDAGGVVYSSILPQLVKFGYENLIAVDLSFQGLKNIIRKTIVMLHPIKNKIEYRYGDITKTKFKNNYFDAITCLSVIEHGVNPDDFFREMSRILKPDSILFISTDYWEQKIDTKGKSAYGVPIHIFSKEEILDWISIAKKYNLHLMEEIDFNCKDKVVSWKGLSYTFIYFTLEKRK